MAKDSQPRIEQLLADHPDDEACLDYLWRRHLSPDGQTARCPHCGVVRRFHRVAARRSYSCDSCGHHLHPAAGTILEHSSVPLRTWFRAILLLADDSPPMTVRALSLELGVNYKTALRMNRLIRERSGPMLLRNALAQATRSTIGVALEAPEPGTLTTVAGSGEPAFVPYRLSALLAQLTLPWGVAVDSAGVLYVSDTESNVVRAVDPDGYITTVAGIGERGYEGDGGQATFAKLRKPTGVAIDRRGGVLIADTGNNVVRRVDTDGIISTIAGRGMFGIAGDGCAATVASLSWPSGLLPVGDELFVAEYKGHAVRRIDADGVISTIAGNGSRITSGDGGHAAFAGVPYPGWLAMDATGNLYVAQSSDVSPNSRVRRVDLSGTISTVAGTGSPGFGGDGGPATDAMLDNPSGLAFDRDGALLIADSLNSRVRRVDRSGTITTVVGRGGGAFGGDGLEAREGDLDIPVGLATDEAGDLFIADSANHRVRRVTAPLHG